jgi:hypothetical protein
VLGAMAMVYAALTAGWIALLLWKRYASACACVCVRVFARAREGRCMIGLRAYVCVWLCALLHLSLPLLLSLSVCVCVKVTVEGPMCRDARVLWPHWLMAVLVFIKTCTVVMESVRPPP